MKTLKQLEKEYKKLKIVQNNLVGRVLDEINKLFPNYYEVNYRHDGRGYLLISSKRPIIEGNDVPNSGKEFIRISISDKTIYNYINISEEKTYSIFNKIKPLL